MLRCILLTVCLLLWGESLSAQSIGMAIFQQPQGEQDCGTACAIHETEDEYIYATVNHGVKGATAVYIGIPYKEKPTEATADGFWAQARVIKTADKDYLSVPDQTGRSYSISVDLAIVGVKKKDNMYFKALPMDYVEPQRGEEVYCSGFGGNKPHNFTARFIETGKLQGANIPGDSGGAVLYQKQLIGIQWGGLISENVTHYTPAQEVYKLIVQTQLRILSPQFGGQSADNGDCVNGRCPTPYQPRGVPQQQQGRPTYEYYQPINPTQPPLPSQVPKSPAAVGTPTGGQCAQCRKMREDLDALTTKVNGIKVPTQTDYSGELKALRDKVDGIKIPEQMDYTQQLTELKAYAYGLSQEIEKLKTKPDGSQELTALSMKLNTVNSKVEVLEPLVKRKVAIEQRDGTRVTREYGPADTIILKPEVFYNE